MRAPEPGTFEHLLQPVDVPVERLVRLSRRPTTELWWGRAGSGRFDDPLQQFGVCYAADQVATAFAETVIHESSAWRHGAWVVAEADLTSRWMVSLQRPAQPQLLLADLTGTALKALGLNNDLCSGADYTLSQQWARAIHDASPRWDGIRYVSRQNNTAYCYAVFERAGMGKAGTARLEGALLEQLCDDFQVIAI
jgi:hypothetical protein